MSRGAKVPVTMRALLQRINRTLADKDEVLKKTRGDGRAFQTLGDYYVLDGRRNVVRRTHVDPEALGRELECLQPWEQVVEEEGDK
jgi:hypothetical protein